MIKDNLININVGINFKLDLDKTLSNEEIPETVLSLIKEYFISDNRKISLGRTIRDGDNNIQEIDFTIS